MARGKQNIGLWFAVLLNKTFCWTISTADEYINKRELEVNFLILRWVGNHVRKYLELEGNVSERLPVGYQNWNKSESVMQNIKQILKLRTYFKSRSINSLLSIVCRLPKESTTSASEGEHISLYSPSVSIINTVFQFGRLYPLFPPKCDLAILVN